MENYVGDLVIVGSSAGGVGALLTLVSTLDKDFPAPVVLAQHLDPQRPSHLGGILQRRSNLPIVVVSEEPPTLLEPGKIYVVPSNRHVTIVDGHLQLEGTREDRPKPSVDMLLSSAAAAFGERLIAVILTGSGSDGAAGAVDVKNAGGIVIIQNPETAPYPSMPLSLPPTVVDHVVDMEGVGRLLHDILKGVDLPGPDKAADPLRELLTLVGNQTNIDFRNYKSATIHRRIARRMAVTHNSSIRDYADFIRVHSEEVKELVRAFLIKVTGFFRDPEAFDLLRTMVLPDLISRARETGRVLRFWSAGCATGEEAYSLALLIADLLGPEFPEWRVRIFATDVAEDAINFARRAIYPETVLKDLPDGYRERFFERIDHGYCISKSLRQAVIFGQQDISRGVPFPRIDLVVCRNLLIYLKPELQRTVLDLFAYSLYPSSGYLFLGKAETARPTIANFELVNKKWKIYRCVAGPLGFALQDSFSRVESKATREARRRPISQFADAYAISDRETEIILLRRINETMLRYTAAGVVIIDRTYRIITINAAGRRLLGIRDVASDQDFLHALRGLPYQEVRAAIDLAFREHSTTSLGELELDHASVGSGHYVDLTVMMMPFEPGDSELVAISVVDATEQVQLKRRLQALQQEQAQLVSELTTANKRFAETNKELQDANEELQAANEELMLTQEELQATNEEFESTNEELQATNEELETNNEELQATNEELQTTNDELSARSAELNQIARQNRVDQLSLSQVLERFPDYIMVLNADNLTIQTINPGYMRLLGTRDVIGLTIEEVFAGEELQQFIGLLKKAIQDGQPFTTKPIIANVPDSSEEGQGAFIHTIVPIREVSGEKIARLFVYSEYAPSRE